MSAVVVRSVGLGKFYEDPGQDVTHALRDVSFEIERGEMVALCGPSGCGKSTLLNLLACMDRPTAGRLFLNGTAVDALADDALCTIRRSEIGMVFQNFHLLGGLSVRENVALPLVLQHRGRLEIRERVEFMLELVGLTDKTESYPPLLSGGQAQRVAIARALVHQPAIILADEPTGNLDSRTGNDIVDLLRDISANGQTIMIATHADNVASACNRTLELMDGSLAV
jgi:ABC-type lipoprotein export system ATPase subunit